MTKEAPLPLYDLNAEMRDAGLTQSDLVRLTGHRRQAFWRWSKSGQAPLYIRALIKCRQDLKRARAFK